MDIRDLDYRDYSAEMDVLDQEMMHIEMPRVFGDMALNEVTIVPGETMIDTKTLLKQLNDRDYLETRQPKYENQQELEDAMRELRMSEGDSTYDTVTLLRQSMSSIAEGVSDRVTRIFGRCNDRVDAKQKIKEIVQDKYDMIEAVQAEDPRSETIIRNTTGKPRSDEFETVKDPVTNKLKKIIPFCGYEFNKPEATQFKRAPDAKMLPAVNAQIRSVGEQLANRHGEHVMTARESLSIPYMVSMMRRAPDGKVFSIESDMIWLGDRTRQLDGLHVAILEELQPENVIGVKIGPTATAEDIIGLQEKLNPGNLPGKLVFMFRMGKEDLSKMHPLLETLRDYRDINGDPAKPILLYDIHGSTQKKSVNGEIIKTRDVTEMIEETWILAAMCKAYGLKLHGTHVEAMGLGHKKQCIDNEDDVPDDTNIMDPLLNLDQLRRFTRETAKVL